MVERDRAARGGGDRGLLEAAIAYLAFGAVSYLGRQAPIAFHLMGIVALAIPLVWGWRTGRWREMGFMTANWRQAVLCRPMRFLKSSMASVRQQG